MKNKLLFSYFCSCTHMILGFLTHNELLISFPCHCKLIDLIILKIGRIFAIFIFILLNNLQFQITQP